MAFIISGGIHRGMLYGYAARLYETLNLLHQCLQYTVAVKNVDGKNQRHSGYMKFEGR
jgi:hypothetical protein